jgi:cytochrome o ubiquinol oxidase subunit III
MTHPAHESYPDPHHDAYSRTVFGFWLYILTDFMLFAALFATYAVLSKSTFGGPTARELFNLSFVFVQTLILLMCSLSSGLASAAAHRKEKQWASLYFGITFLLGIVFLCMEMTDFHRLSVAGNGWNQSAFLSAYFTLLGTHVIHIIIAILWIPILLILLWREEGVSLTSMRRFACLKMFWQFLNIVWIFIFTIVYLLGS